MTFHEWRKVRPSATSDNWRGCGHPVLRSRKNTDDVQSIRVWVVRDVFHQIPTRHPIRNELEWVDGDTQKGEDVRMCQMFPHHRHLVEGLWVSSAPEKGRTWDRIRTSLIFCESPSEDILTYLMRTFEPLNNPTYTHPRRDSGSVHDSGSTSLMPHIHLSS